MKELIVILMLVNLQLTGALGQENWTLAAGKGRIKVYSKTVTGSKIKALKAECIMDATVDEVLDLLMDIPATVKWMCHTKACTLLKKISDRELYYYTEVSLPWPLENRDFVTHMKITQDPVSKVVTVNAPAIPGEVPHKRGLVRINQSESVWTITPVDLARVKLVYTLRVDPGGMIPANVVNYFAKQGPIETFTDMETEIRSRRAIRKSDK
jgi:hypothetical protein